MSKLKLKLCLNVLKFAANAGLLKLTFEAVLLSLAIIVTPTDMSILAALATLATDATVVTFATLVIVAVMDALTT